MATVLVLGRGGREHMLAWKLSISHKVKQVYVAPGNAGTLRKGHIDNVDININDFDSVVLFCQQNEVSLVVVGPEDILADGIVDNLEKNGIRAFGPNSMAAEIEASKSFSKWFMDKNEIPTARFQTFTNATEAIAHINSAEYKALVIKASGLSAGKGVVVAKTRREACQAVVNILEKNLLGSAGQEIVIEEFLDGEEVSVLAFSDGENIALMPTAQDHKQLNEGDQGPNTGGMGAICPYQKISQKDMEVIKTNIIQRTIKRLQREGRTFKGVLYTGLMLTDNGPFVLEFNCRFGDPEAQSILPLMESDLYDMCMACVDGTLKQHEPVFTKDKFVAAVVVVSGGYPKSYAIGFNVTGSGWYM